MSSLFKKVWGSSGATADKRVSKTSQSTTQTIESIETLTQKEEHLEKRQRVIEQRIAAELENAKRYNRENKKNQALMCLKKKKMYEKNMEDLNNLLLKVNEQKILLENAQTTAETLKAIEGATKASKNVLKHNQIDNVDQLMEDIATETDTMNEINQRIAEPTSFLADYDDDDLLADLEEMDAEILDEDLLAPNTVTAVPATTTEELPSVPATKVEPVSVSQQKPKTPEEEELEALAAELA